jgi:signal peptide peptidase SppA
MRLRHAELLTRIVNTPLWAHPRKVAILYNVLADRASAAAIELPDTADALAVDALASSINVKRPTPAASRFEGDFMLTEDGRGIQPFKFHKPSGTGIITVEGSLINRGAWIGSYSGQTSYEGIRHQLTRARDDARVKAIMLDLHTPGGEAVGAFEAAGAVRSAAKRKPVVALVNGMAASAGYALASGATKIVTTADGITGSIGVVMLHLDHSKFLEQEGIAPTFIFAGQHKVDANPLQPLDPDVKAELQGEVQQSYELFIETITEGRGKRASNYARSSEARVFMGQSAVDAKLVDEIGSFDSVLAELSGKRTQRRKSMDGSAEEDTVTTAEATRAVEAARLEGIAEGRRLAAERLTAVLASEAVKGHETFALSLALDNPEMSAENVVKACQRLPAPSAARSVAERGDPNLARISGRSTQAELDAGGDPNAAPGTDFMGQAASGIAKAQQARRAN